MEKNYLVNYYKILEVSPESSQEEIKKQYHKLAKKYHPDFCKDKTKIYLINEAYKILSNETKRKIYDKKLKETEIWKDLSYTPKSPRELLQPSISYSYSYHEKCENCQGKGYLVNNPENICPLCKGQGKIIIFSREQKFQVEKKCHLCKGTGSLSYSLCKECNGKGVKEATQTINLKLEDLEEDCWNFFHRGDFIPLLNTYSHVKIKLNFPSLFQNKKIIIEEKVSVLELLLGKEKEISWPGFKTTLKLNPEKKMIKLSSTLKVGKEEYPIFISLKPFYPKLSPLQKTKIAAIVEELEDEEKNNQTLRCSNT